MTLVCPECFGDRGLKRRIEDIRPSFPDEKCTFHPTRKGVPIKEVAVIVDAIFRAFYSHGEYRPWSNGPEGDPLQFVLQEFCETDYEVAEPLAVQLMEDEVVYPQDGDFAFYADDQSYVRQGAGSSYLNDQLWERFCRSVLHSQRFFNTDAKALIAQLFNNVDTQKNNQKQSPIYEIRPGDDQSFFFRARVVIEKGQAKDIVSDPSGQLGVPPERLRRANRMNPAGIACFYGAFEIDTCIAEIRPPVGGVVATASFELTRPIYVLDMTKFETPIRPMSIFAKAYLEKIEQWAFMQNFMEQIAKPVLPSDEHLDYIPTQAVAEYLQHHHKITRGGRTYNIEGVIFQSAQLPPLKNIVLLGGAGQLLKEIRRSPELSQFQIEAFDALENLSNQRANSGIQYVDGSLAFHEIRSAQFSSEQTAYGL